MPRKSRLVQNDASFIIRDVPLHDPATKAFAGRSTKLKITNETDLCSVSALSRTLWMVVFVIGVYFPTGINLLTEEFKKEIVF